MGAAMVCATPVSFNQSPDRGLSTSLNSAEAKNRSAVDTSGVLLASTGECTASISPMRVWCYLLLSCAIRGRLRLGGFLLGKPLSAGNIAIHKTKGQS